MKAIQVRYLAPTNKKGARLKVWAADLKAEIYPREYSEDYARDAEHHARAYAAKYFRTNVSLAGGVLPNGDYVFVLIPFIEEAK